MTFQEAKKKYHEIFDSDDKKAKAFDLIAEKYYCSNFGSTSKADFDVLMFSLYIDEILKKSQNDFNKYSDYTLSKQLGITQSKINNLKVKKELLYPNSDFCWKEAFLSICDRAVYENGKMMLFIPDRNLYIEIKNAIESTGGYVEVQLTANLLQVKLPYFLDLILAISEEKDRSELRNSIRKRIQEYSKDETIIEKESFGKMLLHETPEAIIDIVSACIPCFGGVTEKVAKTLLKIILQGNKGE